jgi:hypothetical protein
MLLPGAVSGVDAEDIDPRFNQCLQLIGFPAGGPDRGDNLCARFVHRRSRHLLARGLRQNGDGYWPKLKVMRRGKARTVSEDSAIWSKRLPADLKGNAVKAKLFESAYGSITPRDSFDDELR